eukprot:scaffold12893_cov94-Isochrysis_galbana.AAC.2
MLRRSPTSNGAPATGLGTRPVRSAASEMPTRSSSSQIRCTSRSPAQRGESSSAPKISCSRTGSCSRRSSPSGISAAAAADGGPPHVSPGGSGSRSAAVPTPLVTPPATPPPSSQPGIGTDACRPVDPSSTRRRGGSTAPEAAGATVPTASHAASARTVATMEPTSRPSRSSSTTGDRSRSRLEISSCRSPT